jgi:uncharacterized protein
MAYKLSYYSIFSEPLNARNDVVLYSTRSAKAFKISDQLKTQLTEGNPNDLDEETIGQLAKIKVLVPEDENELHTIVTENNRSIETSTTELYEVIQPSAMCQLGCDYCGQQHTKDYISQSVSARLLERIKLKIANGNYKSMFIGWFGGEPLMGLRQMRDLTKELLQLAEENKLGYGAKVVTNGLSLKPAIFRELATELKVQHIEITLDGIGEYHDQRRITKEGNSTFDIIFKNIVDITSMPDFFDLGCKISLRCNVDYRNVDGVSPLIKFLAEHKLHEKLAYFYPIGVYSWGGNTAHKKSLTKEQFAEMEIGWMIEMIEHGFLPSLLPGRVKQVCMAVSKNSEMYDAFGNIFNCTEVSYTDFYKGTPYSLGNLKQDNTNFSVARPLSTWYSDMEDPGAKKFPCTTCKMLPVCGGGCPKSWHEDMRACPSAKFNIKDRLALSYVIAKHDIRELKTPEAEPVPA